MNKLLLIGGGAVAAAAIGAAVVGPNYLGGKIEEVTKVQFAGDKLKPFKAEVVKYERGARASDVEIKFGLDNDCLGEKAEAAKDAYILYRAKLSHGPFAGGLNAASYTGDLLLSPKLQSEVEKITDQKILATIEGTYGFSGASDAVLTVPKFDINDDKSSGKFAGMKFDIHTDASGLNTRYSGKSDGLTLKGKTDDKTFAANNFEMNGNRSIVAPGIYSGEAIAKLNKIVASSEGKEAIKLDDFSYTTKSEINDKKLLTVNGKFGIAKINLPESKASYKNAVLDMSMSNIASEPYSRINAKMNCKQAQDMIAAFTKQDETTVADNFAQLLPLIKDDLKLLLAANPLLELKKMGVEAPEGPIDMNAKLNLAGVVDADWAEPMMFLKRLNIEGKASAPNDIIPQEAKSVVGVLITNGFLTINDKQLTTTFKYVNGAGLINGKPAESIMGALMSAGAPK